MSSGEGPARPTGVHHGSNVPGDDAGGPARARARLGPREPSGGPARYVARSPYEERRRPPPRSTVPGPALESASAWRCTPHRSAREIDHRKNARARHPSGGTSSHILFGRARIHRRTACSSQRPSGAGEVVSIRRARSRAGTTPTSRGPIVTKPENSGALNHRGMRAEQLSSTWSHPMRGYGSRRRRATERRGRELAARYPQESLIVVGSQHVAGPSLLMGRCLLPGVLLGLLSLPTLAEHGFTVELRHRGLLLPA